MEKYPDWGLTIEKKRKKINIFTCPLLYINQNLCLRLLPWAEYKFLRRGAVFSHWWHCRYAGSIRHRLGHESEVPCAPFFPRETEIAFLPKLSTWQRRPPVQMALLRHTGHLRERDRVSKPVTSQSGWAPRKSAYQCNHYLSICYSRLSPIWCIAYDQKEMR